MSLNDITSHLLSGLRDVVSISIDPWGVAHIRAENRDDLFYAQGWNAARDRLWQMDVARKRGLGLLSNDFGPGYLAQDRAARLFLYRGDMAAEWAAYGADTQAVCSAFAAGINAYIDGVLCGDLPAPPEFALLGNSPSYWAPEDVVRIRSHSLTRNASSELLRARIFALMGPDAGARLDLLRCNLEPPIRPEVPEGLDLDSLTADILRDFHLALGPVTFQPQRLAASLDQANLWTAPAAFEDIDGLPRSDGSNNWVISGERTASGRPILCLDPHRTHVLPSVRYIVHLTMPGLDVIGAGEPTMPGIAMGHNGHAAFGLTIYGHDQEDIVSYDLHPEDPGLYRHNGDWQRVHTVSEAVPVKGYPDQIVTLQFTCHGPVLARQGGHLFALRTVWTMPGTAPYLHSLKVMRARTPTDYLDALKDWGCPSVNHVYGDQEGHIVWKPAGAFPIRRSGDGLLPVPGDGPFEWTGLHGAEANPCEIDPKRGFVATANAMNLPEDWNGPIPGHEWLDRSRHDWLNARLAENSSVTLNDCAQMQLSTHSEIAARLTKWLMRQPLPARMHRLLSGFDGDLACDSAAAAFIEVWTSRHLGQALAMAEGAVPEILPLMAPYDVATLAHRLEANVALTPWIRNSLEAAWKDCTARMGPEASLWAWGHIHHLTLRHPLYRQGPNEWSCAPLALGGSSSSPNYAGYDAASLEVLMGPSVRMLIDVGAWDNSLFINTPGQSGCPGSRHYQDLRDAWSEGRYFPLLYTPARVAAASIRRIELLPVHDR